MGVSHLNVKNWYFDLPVPPGARFAVVQNAQSDDLGPQPVETGNIR